MNVPRHGLPLDDPGERTLGRVLRRRAELHPDRPYVVAGDDVVTFGRMDLLADRYAAGLHRLGVGPGDTVALLVRRGVDVVPLTFAVNRLGAVWVPTNPEYRGAWLAGALADSRAGVLVAEPDLLDAALSSLAAGPWPFHHVVVVGDGAPALPAGSSGHPLASLGHDGQAYPEHDAAYGDTAAVLWTSGTTGRPKGVMQSHNAWIRAALTGAASTRTGADDVLYCCLPLHNSAAFVGVVYRALVAGVPFGLDGSFSVTEFWDRTRFYGATQTFTLGAMHLFLWQAPERPDDADNPVRCMGAIPMPDAIVEPFKRRFGIESVQQGFGQSEVMGLLTRCDDGSRTWKPGALGVPLPGVEVALLNDDDRPVPVGEAGQFCVRPTEPHVLFNGYFNDPAATVEAWRNLWYHTGDLGRQDGDGDYFFVDRRRDLIRFMGRSIPSVAVEAMLTAHPAVAEAAAFGVATDGLEAEAEIMATVALAPGASVTEEELARFVNERAPHFYVPRYIDLVPSLPRTPTGKVQKFVLRQRGPTPTTWDRREAGFAVSRPPVPAAATRSSEENAP